MSEVKLNLVDAEQTLVGQAAEGSDVGRVPQGADPSRNRHIQYTGFVIVDSESGI